MLCSTRYVGDAGVWEPKRFLSADRKFTRGRDRPVDLCTYMSSFCLPLLVKIFIVVYKFLNIFILMLLPCVSYFLIRNCICEDSFIKDIFINTFDRFMSCTIHTRARAPVFVSVGQTLRSLKA